MFRESAQCLNNCGNVCRIRVMRRRLPRKMSRREKNMDLAVKAHAARRNSSRKARTSQNRLTGHFIRRNAITARTRRVLWLHVYTNVKSSISVSLSERRFFLRDFCHSGGKLLKAALRAEDAGIFVADVLLLEVSFVDVNFMQVQWFRSRIYDIDLRVWRVP